MAEEGNGVVLAVDADEVARVGEDRVADDGRLDRNAHGVRFRVLRDGFDGLARLVGRVFGGLRGVRRRLPGLRRVVRRVLLGPAQSVPAAAQGHADAERQNESEGFIPLVSGKYGGSGRL